MKEFMKFVLEFLLLCAQAVPIVLLGLAAFLALWWLLMKVTWYIP